MALGPKDMTTKRKKETAHLEKIIDDFVDNCLRLSIHNYSTDWYEK